MQRSVTSETNYSQILCFPVLQNDRYRETALRRAARLTGTKTEHLLRDFAADNKQVLHLYGNRRDERPRRVYLLGLGDNPSVGSVIKTVRSFIFSHKKELTDELGVILHGNTAEHRMLAEAFANGSVLGTYSIGRWQTADKPEQLEFSDNGSLQFFVGKKFVEATEEASERGNATGETQAQIFDLVNAPANKKNPEDIADWAEKSGATHGYRVTVFDKERCEKENLGGLLAVNRGSEFPARFVIMEYQPEKSELPHIGLVGKGVTFDTGGVSIKPSSNMHFMKSDMGGAAAVLGTMELTAKLGLPVRLTGIIGLTDNSVDAKSVKPSDVIPSYSGKNIEIIDTDAEGRLVLADGLSYIIRNYQPDTVLDLATLTGSSVRTFGYFAGALLTENDGLAQQLRAAGDRTGERVWPLPMWDEYGDYMKSDVADVKNFSGLPIAGAITAAKFLQHFTDQHERWAHLDIAGVAIANGEFSKQRSATAFGVRLLVDWLEQSVVA